MPRYTIQDPTGRRLTVEGPTPPTPAQIKAIFDANPAPAQAPEAPETPTTLERVTQGLNLPLNTMTGAITTGLRTLKGTAGTAPKEPGLEGWEQVLAETGMPKGAMRSGLSLAGDIVLDPLNAMPSSWVTKPLGVAGDALKAFGATSTGQNLAKLTRPARELFQQYPGTAGLMGRSGKLSAEDMFRLEAAKQAALAQNVQEQLLPAAELLKDEASRKAVARFMDNPATAGPITPAQQQAAAQLQSLLKEQGLLEQEKSILGDLRENYFPYVFKSQPGRWGRQTFETGVLKGTTPFDKTRLYPSLEAAIEGAKKDVDPTTGLPRYLVEDDAIEAVSKRMVAGQRAVSNVEFVNRMTREFGRTAAEPGLRRLNVERLRLPKVMQDELKTVYFPESVADQLDKTAVIWGDPQGFAKLAQKATSLFKGVVTATPSFHATNLQGNTGMMYIGGMSAPDILKAYDPRTSVPELNALLDNGRRPTTNMAKVLKMTGPMRQRIDEASASIDALRARPIEGSDLTMGQAMDLAKAYNLFGSSEAQVALEAFTKQAGALKTAGEASRLIGSRFIEDPARWGLYLDQLRKGVPVEQAILHTKNILIDYNELTGFEKGIRDYGVMPFYSWFRKVVPALTQAVVTRPARINTIQDIYGAPERFTGEVSMPDWMREEGYVPRVGLNPLAENFLQRTEGETPGSVGVMRAANPLLELNRVTNPRGAVAGLLGPVPRAGLEWLTQRDLRTNQPLLDTRTGYVKAAPIAALAESMGLTGLPGGAIPTPTGMVQAELPAFLMRQIPLPLVPYAQQFLGSVPEQLGQTRAMSLLDRAQLLSLRMFGLTPRDLTPDQQLQVYRDALQELEREANAQQVQQTGQLLRERRR